MPDTPLAPDKIEALAREFTLPYHVHQAALCQEQVGFAGKEVLEVGGSLPPALVFDQFKARRWVSVETPDYDASLKDIGGITHLGSLLGDRTVARRTFDNALPLEDYTFFYDDIIRLPRELEQRFNLVFSLAAFEHIHRLPQALERMYASLKPGGKLFTYFSPVWSSFHGHHLPDITDAAGRHYNFMESPVPPWGHLLLSPPQMLEFLKNRTDLRTAEEMVYFIYNAPNINRFFVEDFAGFIKATPFVVERFDGILPVNHYPPDIKAQLDARYPGRTFFNVDGLLIILSKPQAAG